jgi:glycosyltransferase involved in cell wall biosynthesis
MTEARDDIRPTAPHRRILLYIHGLTGGGAERIWAVLAGALADRGHEVTLAVDFEANENLKLLNGQVRVVVLHGGHFANVWHLSRLFRTSGPEIALAAVSGSNLKLVLAKLIAASRVPIVLSVHGFWEHLTGWLGWLGMKTLFLSTRLADRTVTVSDGLKSFLIEDWAASPRRTVRIYNPVAIVRREEAPDRQGLAERPEIVLAVGRLVADKDVATLVRAFSRLERPKARLVILGDGPLRAVIEDEIRHRGLEGRVELAGYRSEPWGYYARARCLAHAARQEAFGNIIVEALAHGLPVVATDCDGPSEILDGGRFGTLVPVGDAAALARGIESALKDPGDPAPRIARAAEFSVSTGVRQYEALIEEVLAERGCKATARSG